MYLISLIKYFFHSHFNTNLLKYIKFFLVKQAYSVKLKKFQNFFEKFAFYGLDMELEPENFSSKLKINNFFEIIFVRNALKRVWFIIAACILIIYRNQNRNFFKSRNQNRNHNFSKVETGTWTVKNSYGSTMLRRTAWILLGITICSIYFVFRGIIFCRKFPTLDWTTLLAAGPGPEC
jgi:hypothetical protein